MEPIKKPRSIPRHERDCVVCTHPDRERIEEDVVRWKFISKIAREYGFRRQSLDRHVRALGLIEKRNQNLEAVSLRIIETGLKNLRNVGAHEINAATMILAKLRGIWVNRSQTQTFSMTEFFKQMSRLELQEFISSRKLPSWVQTELEKRKDASRLLQ